MEKTQLSKEPSKEQVLSDLYAIRAAMSLVSQNQDSIEQAERRIYEIPEPQKSCFIFPIRHQESQRSYIESISQNRERERENICIRREQSIDSCKCSKQLEKLKEKEEFCRDDYARRKNIRIMEFKNIIFDWGVLGAILFVASILIIWLAGFNGISQYKDRIDYYTEQLEESLKKSDEYEINTYTKSLETAKKQYDKIMKKGGTILLICVAVNAVVDVVIWLKVRRHMKCKKKERENLLKQLNEYQVMKDRIQSLQQAGKEYVESLPEYQEAMQEYQNDLRELERKISIDNKRAEELRNFTLPVQAQSKAIIESTKAAYPIIDFRDWKHIDLLIFYYETGRAETLKEALQHVDGQARTDQIVHAIQQASHEIAGSINDSVRKLGSALEQAFDKLSYQFASQHSQIMTSMATQAKAIDLQRSAIEEQTKQQMQNAQMSKALMEKINVSSSQLAADIDKQTHFVYQLK